MSSPERCFTSLDIPLWCVWFVFYTARQTVGRGGGHAGSTRYRSLFLAVNSVYAKWEALPGLVGIPSCSCSTVHGSLASTAFLPG